MFGHDWGFTLELISGWQKVLIQSDDIFGIIWFWHCWWFAIICNNCNHILITRQNFKSFYQINLQLMHLLWHWWKSIDISLFLFLFCFVVFCCLSTWLMCNQHVWTKYHENRDYSDIRPLSCYKHSLNIHFSLWNRSPINQFIVWRSSKEVILLIPIRLCQSKSATSWHAIFNCFWY